MQARVSCASPRVLRQSSCLAPVLVSCASPRVLHQSSCLAPVLVSYASPRVLRQSSCLAPVLVSCASPRVWFPCLCLASVFVSCVVLVSIWTLSSLLAVPTAVALRVSLDEDDRVPRCESRNMDKELFSTYSHLLVGIQYFLPLGIVSFAYFKIARKLWGSRTPGNAEDARDAHVLKNKKKAIKMLFVVVAMFAFCWLPLQTYHVLQVIYPHINEYRYINIIWFSFHWLAMSNSCVNPFIYAIYNEKFKREFRHKCRHCMHDAGGDHELSDEQRSRMSHLSFRYRSTRTSFLDSLAAQGGNHNRPRFSGGTACADRLQRSGYPLPRRNTKRSLFKLPESGAPQHDQRALHRLMSTKDTAAKSNSFHDCHVPRNFAFSCAHRGSRMNNILRSKISKITEDATSNASSFNELTSETSFNHTDSLPCCEGPFEELIADRCQQNGPS
ncbi:G protein-coupled receptor rhodopsin-like [Trinorchestia longiramus]|nr:G protein-coupled receptor rhodopsin-like [Trinorchestia longiramus]